MDQTLLTLIAVFLLLAGIGLIYLTLRGNRPFWPKDGFQWAAVGLSSVLVLAAGFLIVMLATTQVSVRPLGPNVAEAGLDEPAPNFSFHLVGDDTEMDLDAYKGKVVLLNFWATWCQPCLMEMPELNRLQEVYADEGLVVLTISDDAREDLVAFEDVMELKTVSGYVLDPSTLEQPFAQMVEVRPTTFVIDRDGIVRRSIVGAGNFELFADAVSPYLAQTVAAR